MTVQRNRRLTPKGMLEKMVGRKIDPNLLPAIHKVQIMEYLLSCPHGTLAEYQDNDNPSFICQCVDMLREGRILEFTQVLNLCRQMAREDALNAK